MKTTRVRGRLPACGAVLFAAALVAVSAHASAQTSAPSAEAQSSIAPPPPDADPQKVDEAKAVAETAKVTPIVPSPRNPTRPAFQLYAELDIPVLGIGAVFAAARLTKSQRAYCAPLCDTADLNPLDRITAGYYSPTWGTISDVGLSATVVGTLVLVGVDEGPLDGLNDAVVIAESALSATAVSTVMTLAAGRPRPLLFGTKAPLSERQSANAGLSFLSSHAAVTSSIALSTFMTMKRLHPTSDAPYIVLSVGGASALFVATARIMAGEHFITDSIGGLIVGSSLGILVPALHDSPVKVVPVTGSAENGVRVVGSF